MTPKRPMPSWVRVGLAALAVLTLAYAAQVTFIVIPRPASGSLEKVATNVVVIGAALLCGWRAVAVRPERAAWLCFAAGLLSWGIGDIYFALALWDLDTIPIPSLA